MLNLPLTSYPLGIPQNAVTLVTLRLKISLTSCICCIYVVIKVSQIAVTLHFTCDTSGFSGWRRCAANPKTAFLGNLTDGLSPFSVTGKFVGWGGRQEKFCAAQFPEKDFADNKSK